MFAIASNSDETKQEITRVVKTRDIPFPVLLDPGGKIADYFGVERTPETFLLDGSGKLVYQGAIDNETWAHHEGDIGYLKKALDETLEGRAVTKKFVKSSGRKLIRSV